MVAKARAVPMIGDGSARQYLLHERTLAEVVQRAVRGDFDQSLRPLTIAEPEGIEFRALLQAPSPRRNTSRSSAFRCLGGCCYCQSKTTETAAGLKLNFRSDSVISFIFQNQAPDFEALSRYGIDPIRLDA